MAFELIIWLFGDLKSCKKKLQTPILKIVVGAVLSKTHGAIEEPFWGSSKNVSMISS